MPDVQRVFRTLALARNRTGNLKAHNHEQTNHLDGRLRRPPSAFIRRRCAWATPSGCPARFPWIRRPRKWCNGDIEAQIRQVFENLKAIVVAAGASFDDVVKATVFLTDLSHFALVNKIMAEYFREPYPARAAVGVAALPRGAQVEVECIVALARVIVTASKPVTVLRGVGDALAERLRALGVETTQDLLFLLPLRYEDRTRVVPLGELRARAARGGGGRGAAHGGRVSRAAADACRIADGSGFLTLRFFYFTAQQQNGLARGVRIRCFGEARRGPKGLEIVHPEYRRIDPDAARGADGASDADLSRHRRR